MVTGPISYRFILDGSWSLKIISYLGAFVSLSRSRVDLELRVSYFSHAGCCSVTSALCSPVDCSIPASSVLPSTPCTSISCVSSLNRMWSSSCGSR